MVANVSNLIAATAGSVHAPQLQNYLDKVKASPNGAAALPQVDLNTRVATAGPIEMNGEGEYDMLVYSAPLMTRKPVWVNHAGLSTPPKLLSEQA